MKRFILLFSLIFTVQILAQSPGEAIAFLDNETGSGVRAQGLGNAFTAVADDWSALYWNPAGLTLLETSEISGAFYHTKFTNNATFGGEVQMGNDAFTEFKEFGLAYKFPTSRGSFVLAIGRHNFKNYDDYLSFSGFNGYSNGLEFDLGEEEAEYFPFDRNVWQTEEILQSGNLGAWSFGGGLALSPQFSIGLSFHVYTGANRYAFAFTQEDFDQIYESYPANYDYYQLNQLIDSEFSGGGVSIGGLFHLSDELRAGVSYDFPSKLNVHEIYSSNDLLIFDDGYESMMDFGTGEWEYAVRYPGKLSGGLAIDSERLLLAASASYRDWTDTKFERPDEYGLSYDYQDLLAENQTFTTDFRDVLSWSVGGEFRFTGPNVRLRGGYQVTPSSLAEADKSMNRTTLSGGIGYDIDPSTSFNISVSHGSWKRYSEDGWTPGGTKETIETDRVLAGIVYHF
ncbi:outer membrane protein transport protein [candidate division KSB1 bacterium]|nr:outer membrane protein transport protein [candidate division KSB1 bacterium]